MAYILLVTWLAFPGQFVFSEHKTQNDCLTAIVKTDGINQVCIPKADADYVWNGR